MEGESKVPAPLEPQISEKEKTKTTPPSIIANMAEELGVCFLITKEGAKTISERYEDRLKKEHHLQQESLEKIFKLAFDNTHPEKAKQIDPDWLSYFTAIAKTIRNNSMQQLWSRILRQESLTPGSVSLKTLDTLRSMTHKEAQVFHRACTLSCHFGTDKSKKILTALKARHKFFPSLFTPTLHKVSLGNFSLPYSDLLILLELGLILKSELESGELASGAPLPFSYQNHTYQLTPHQKGLSFTYYRLSPTGQEIADLLGSKTHEPFRETILELLAPFFMVESHQ
ncbi:TIGR03899 family protein [Photobacterium rosenbergii]|uniref:TIGR03899 family protein n=1 Tax=Photobacterium rosenbergii TaxID=294936 RepID=A0ABU3ZQR1_9GAMM|nr:TIGR03899 family protein [Photobacterium rosenbergii]MDV5172451.1 TIGR03899 family protein [Photobacterium rosenbergii]